LDFNKFIDKPNKKYYFLTDFIYHNTGTNELANEATATPKMAGNKTRLRPNLSDSRPMIKAPGIHPMNNTDCDRLA